MASKVLNLGQWLRKNSRFQKSEVQIQSLAIIIFLLTVSYIENTNLIKTAHSKSAISFLNGPSLASFSFYFRLFKHYIFYNKKM